MEERGITIVIESIVGILLGIFLIFGRMHIARIFTQYASQSGLNYTAAHQRILFMIIWIIGVVFILGGLFQIIKTSLK
jgi:small neutral amino acid transporter SnatA (MarC family)